MPSIYDIMIEMNLDDKVSEGLKGIGESFDKLLAQLESLHEGLSSTLLMGAAVGLALGLNKIASAADEATDALQKMGIAGEDMREVWEAAERATAMVPGTTTGMNVELQRRLLPFTGGATENLPDYARADYWLRSVYGRQQGLDQLVRIGSNMGLSGDALKNFVEQGVRAEQASGGNWDPSQLAMAMKRGGLALGGTAQSFVTTTLPYLETHIPGGRDTLARGYGNLLRTLQHPGHGGAIDWDQWRAFTASRTTGAGVRGTGADLFARNPDEWVARWGESLKRRYGDDPEFIRQILQKTIKDQALAQAVWMQMFQAGAIQEFGRRQAAAPGMDPTRTEEFFRHDPVELRKVIAADIGEMFETISKDIQPVYMRQLNWFYDSIHNLTTQIKNIDPQQIASLFEMSEHLAAALGTLAGVRIGLTLLTGANAPLVLAALAVAKAFGVLDDIEAGDAIKAANDLDRAFRAINDFLNTVEKVLNTINNWTTVPGTWLHEQMRRLGIMTPDPIARGNIIDPYIKPGDTQSVWSMQGIPRAPGVWGEDTESTFARMPYQQRYFGVPGTSAPAPAPAPIGAPPVPYIRIIPPMWSPPAPELQRFGADTPTNFASLPAPPPPSTTTSPGWSPSLPPSQHDANINLVLNIDGRTIGQVVAEQILAMNEFGDTGTSASWQAGNFFADGNNIG